MTTADTNPGAVSSLMRRLKSLAVELPEELLGSADQLTRLVQVGIARPAVPSDLLGRTDADLDATLRELALGYTLAVPGGPGVEAIQAVTRGLAGEMAAALAARADDILDQLRPTFDDAAAAAHRATELGISPQTTDRDVLAADDVAATRDAWAALPAAARTLQAIAAARIALSQAAGAPPAVEAVNQWRTGRNTEADLALTMFRTDGIPWRADFEEEWQLWLRLCRGTPARLLTIAECVRTADRIAA